jgi:UDP-N-acetylmuramyl pentapeptide synthase
MELLLLLGGIGFAIHTAHKIAGLLFLWWRKEYRIDRMRIHLNTAQGKSMVFSKAHIGAFLLVLLFLIPGMQGTVIVLLSVFYVILGIMNGRSIRNWHIPPVSPKVILLGLSLIGIPFFTVFFTPFHWIVSLGIADLLLFPVSAGIVTLLTVPTRLYHFIKIRQAISVLRAHKKMSVIGITGSYGKTSVKEYVSAILATQHKTLKTEASKNSPIGIAEVVLRKLTPDTELFVVEMGAYRPGEIGEMSVMVKPEVGILTAINPQHQDLFGSIETTMQAKYELVQGLVGKRIVVANLDDPRVCTMAQWAKRDGCTVWGWTIQPPKKIHERLASQIFYGDHIHSDIHGVRFDCRYKSDTIAIKAPVVGVHQAGNILAAIAGAVALGMEFRSAAKAASTVSPAEKVMRVCPGVKGSIFIDDTFNNNPDAAMAAIRFLGNQKGKRILVFQPMVELGKYAESSHEAVGVVAGENCDVIFLTNGNFSESFIRGVKKSAPKLPVLIEPPSPIAVYIRDHADKGDVVLFKGKDAEHALHLLV